MDGNEAVTFAYMDYPINKIIEMDLSEEDLRKIAGMCGKWAFETAKLDVRETYLERAETLSLLAIESYIMNVDIGEPV